MKTKNYLLWDKLLNLIMAKYDFVISLYSTVGFWTNWIEVLLTRLTVREAADHMWMAMCGKKDYHHQHNLFNKKTQTQIAIFHVRKSKLTC